MLVVNRKGGVGKTTLCDELLFSLERSHVPSAYIDLDDQNSSVHEDSTDTSDTAEVVLIDTPGAFNKSVSDWMRAADVIIIPSNPSGRDIPMLMDSLEKAREVNPGATVIIAVNRFNKYKAASDFMAAVKEIKEAGEDVVALPQSEVFQKAYLNKRSVVEEAPKNVAALRTLQAVNTIRSALGIQPDPTPVEPIEEAINRQQQLANKRKELHNQSSMPAQ